MAPERTTAWLQTILRQYSVLLLIVLALVPFGLGRVIVPRLAWFGLAWFALAVVVFLLAGRRPELFRWQPRRVHLTIILTGLFAAALALRFLPYLHTDIPIGYDYGFYKATMVAYEDAAPNVPEGSLPLWMKIQFPPLAFILHEILHVVAGLDATTHLGVLFPILSAALVFPLYATTRDYFGTGAGLVAAGFYVASFAQYTVFEYLYLKNVLGLWLLLGLFYVIDRGRWVAGGILLGALGSLHRPTFLLAAVSLAVVATWTIARTRDIHGWATTAAVSLPLFLPFWFIRFDQFFDFGFGVVQGAGSQVGQAVPEGGGTFLNFLQYQSAAITYLPLAMAGAVLLLWRNKGLLPVAAFTLSFLNVLLAILFFNRFIIMLDLVAMPLVTAAFMATTHGLKTWIRPTILVLLLILTAAPTVSEAVREPHPPYAWITDQQQEGIHWIADNTPADATILASNLDAPYVIADSHRRTYGPGLFDDPNTGTQWRRFFTTDNETQIRDHLAVYPEPLFIYHAEGHGGMGTAKFTPPLFDLVYDQDGAKVWRYTP